MCACVCDSATHTDSTYYLHWGRDKWQLDPGTDTLMPSILFLHLVLTYLLGCGDPISGIISKSTQNLGVSEGVGRWAVQ